MKGKRVCKAHGGASTGPLTEAGRQRCADAKKVHGRETRAMRHARSLTVARLAALEALAHALNMVSGPRTRGPKPKQQVVDIFDPLTCLKVKKRACEKPPSGADSLKDVKKGVVVGSIHKAHCRCGFETEVTVGGDRQPSRA